MVQRATMRPPKGGNIKKGVCENHQYLNPDTGETGDCPNCASGEVQYVKVQRLSDFRCSKCGAKLTPVKDSFMQKYGKVLIPGIIVLLIAGGLGFWWSNTGNEDGMSPIPSVTDTIDTDTIKTDTTDIDSLKTEEVASIEDTLTVPPTSPVVNEAPDAKAHNATPAPAPKPAIRVPFGTYSGPANGLDGEIKVTSRYTLDLRNAAHETIELHPGDVITRTKFKNGELVSGYWRRGSESRSFHR